MNNRAKFVLLVLALSLTGANLSWGGDNSTAIQQRFANQQAGTVSAIITLADQVDLQSLKNHLNSIGADRRLWHETVVRALQEKAITTQGGLIAELDALTAEGLVESYKPLWIANMIIVKASKEALDRINQRDDVAQISPEYGINIDAPISRSLDVPIIADAEPSLRVIHADQCWQMGITGAGRLISSIETGVDANHPALHDSWAGQLPQYEGHTDWAWFDPVTYTLYPQDWATHGTFMTGVMCGRHGSDTIGVAIDAHWISCGVIGRVSIERTVQDALLSMQWNADPDGDPATVWDVPDVCCCPWGFVTAHGYPPCDDTFWAAIDGMEAAGVVAIFSAGGEGPASNSIVRPADRATSSEKNFCVGAIDNTDSNYPVTSFSSRGPSYCTSDGSADFKPEVSGPGINITSSVPGGGYEVWSGTASATSFVAGVVALMRQANPNLSSDGVKDILLLTASDLGPVGDDNSYGMGLVDAFVAVSLSQDHGCHYVPGDVNDDGAFNGIDVTFMVGYFKGGSNPLYTCDCPPGNFWFVAGDVNGNCNFNGIDVTYSVSYFKGGAAPVPCPDCPPAE